MGCKSPKSSESVLAGRKALFGRLLYSRYVSIVLGKRGIKLIRGIFFGSSRMLYNHLHRASISKYLSFAQHRISRVHIQMMVPEMKMVGYINQNVLREWKRQMAEHNAVVRRGNEMHLLLFRVSEYSDLSLYMYRMQKRYLASLLTSFSDFGDRVMKLVSKDPGGRVLKIAGQVAIESIQWNRLCAQIMNVLQLLGCDSASNPENEPDDAILAAAMLRAKRIFGRFGCADPDVIPIASRCCGKRSVNSELCDSAAHATPKRRRRTVASNEMMTNAAWTAKLAMAQAACLE